MYACLMYACQEHLLGISETHYNKINSPQHAKVDHWSFEPDLNQQPKDLQSFHALFGTVQFKSMEIKI